MADPVKRRETGRVLLLSPAGRLALMRAPGFDGGRVWVTFGGRLEAGESPRQAALRETLEEAGREDVALGEAVYVRDERRVIDGEETRLVETFFVARLPDETLSREGWTQAEKEKIDAVRWWSLDELRATDEIVRPRNLAALFAEALTGPQAERP